MRVRDRLTPLLAAAKALQPARLFVSGLGYVGLRAAVKFREAFPDCAVAGCVRSSEKAEALRARYPGPAAGCRC